MVAAPLASAEFISACTERSPSKALLPQSSGQPSCCCRPAQLRPNLLPLAGGPLDAACAAASCPPRLRSWSSSERRQPTTRTRLACWAGSFEGLWRIDCLYLLLLLCCHAAVIAVLLCDPTQAVTMHVRRRGADRQWRRHVSMGLEAENEA